VVHDGFAADLQLLLGFEGWREGDRVKQTAAELIKA
jgi:hypothetical protein